MKRLPSDSFEHRVGLGTERSHQLVADHLGVSERTVSKRPNDERWQERLRAILLDA